jgi:hypothetical protein
MQAVESAYKNSRARIFFILTGSLKFALERSQKALHFVQRGRILLRCGSAFALSLPSLGVSSLDLGRLFTQAALFLGAWQLRPPRGFAGRIGIRAYFSDVLIDVNLSLMLVPRLFTMAMIASEIPAAIRPYSIAVAPDSSDRNFKIFCFNFSLQPV